MKLDNIVKDFIEIEANLLKTAHFVSNQIGAFKQFEFTIDNCNLTTNLSEFNNLSSCIYYFQIVHWPQGCNPVSFKQKIQLLKNRKSNRLKLPQINIENNSNILYVGKSNGLFSNRLKQHLCSTSKQTYALHLSELKQFFGSMKLILHYTQVDNDIYKQQQYANQKRILEIIETALHQNLKPILGRRGH